MQPQTASFFRVSSSPEAIAFSIIAGVDPKVDLNASFCIAVVTAFVGGRSGMISTATGAMARNLALGVLAGVLLGALVFAYKIGRTMYV